MVREALKPCYITCVAPAGAFTHHVARSPTVVGIHTDRPLLRMSPAGELGRSAAIQILILLVVRTSMAVWQARFELRPDEASLPPDYRERLGGLLPVGKSWAPELETWGDEDGNRV